MKNCILILAALAFSLSACDKKTEEEYISYVLSLEQFNTGPDNAEIDVVVVGPKIAIDTFYVKIFRQTSPPDSNLYVFSGTRRPGKYHFSLKNLSNGDYRFFVYAITNNGQYKRYVRTEDKVFTIIAP
jgi:hypothetical protein